MDPIINIKLGGAPVTQAVIERAKESYMVGKGWTAAMRDDAMAEDSFARRGWMSETPNYDRILPALAAFENALIWTMQINSFNAALAAYRAASTRLERHVLSSGRPEITAEIDTGKFNPDGSPYLETVVTQPAIEPVPATIETANEAGQTIVSPNPAIAQDEAERAAAQSVMDGMPALVASMPDAIGVYFEGL